MSLDTILDSIAGELKAELSELKTSELVGGRVDIEEMRRRSTQLPAAFVCCTATRKGTAQYGKFHCRGFFLVVLVVQSRAEGQPVKQDRAHAIARMVSRALKVIGEAGDWGDNEVVSNPEDISSMNPYSKAADVHGIALWGITWEQDLELKGDPPPADLPDLTSIHTDWKMEESAQPEDAEDDIDTDGP